MGMFGQRRPMSAAQQVQAGGDGMDPSTVPHGDPRNRVFGDGSLGGIASGIGKVLSYGPFIGMAQEGMNRRRQLDDSNMAYKAAMAQHAMQPETSDIMREAASMGLRPGTKEYAEFITKYRMKPTYVTLGNPETGQTVIDPSQMGGGQGAIDPEAIARLKANPGEAAMFDEHFGPGSAATILGAQ